MSMLGKRRKSDDALSKTGLYIRKREEAGLPLPPTMRRGTPEYIKASYWQTLKQRTVGSDKFIDSKRNSGYKRRGTRLEMSKADFCSWVDDNWHRFALLYSEGKIPSIDRIRNDEPYSIGNIQVIDLRENMAKDRRIKVTAIPVGGGDSLSFSCAKDAVSSGFCNKAIGRAIKVNGTHKGYKWRKT